MRRSLRPRGFTLVELLVSMAIALLLIVGINMVFRTTAKTVGAGQSLLSAGRDARTFLQTMYVDLNDIDPVVTPYNLNGDPVCFLIQSSHIYAFRNFDDMQGAANQSTPWSDPTLFPNGGPWLGGNTSPVPFVHFRSHRVDKLGFFARGLFTRETSSNSTSFTSPTTSSEAWILYEHAMQPNKGVVTNAASGSSNWFGPGAAYAQNTPNQNDFNYYAADWMLARLAVLLVPTPNPSTDPIYLLDGGGLTPLSSTSRASLPIPNEGGSDQLLYTSRLDIAQTSIHNYGLPSRVNGLASYGYTINPMTGAIVGNTNYGTDWWDPMISQRIYASPFLLTPTGTSPTAPKLDPYGLATAAPSLIRGCTQFIVEYAGNYYTKDNVHNDGRASATLSDGVTPQTVPTPDPSGQLDYFVDSNGNRRIRWYGFPRLVLLSNSIAATPANIRIDPTYGNPAYLGGGGNAAIDAVIPLRDVLDAMTPTGISPTWGSYATAERFSTSPAFPASGSNYWTQMNPTVDQGLSPYVYTAAWGPDNTHQAFPKMVRIVICIDDHEGRLSQPQFYEYVFDVQQ